MGSGASSIPMQINKEKFRQLSGGTFNDAIFDANAVNGLISRDKLIELAQTSDCLLSFEDGIDVHGRQHVDRIGRINDYLRARGLNTTSSRSEEGGTAAALKNLVPQICSTVDRTRSVLFFITQNYMQRIGGASVTDKNKIEFNYSLKKKNAGQLIPIIMEDPLRNRTNWNGPLTQAIGGMSCLDFSSDDDFDAKCEALFQRIITIIRGGVSPTGEMSTTSSSNPSHASKEETQFFQWMARCTNIEESRRIVYCGALVQAGVRNVHLLAQALKSDPNFLIKLGCNEYDADEIAGGISDLGLGFTLSRDFSGASTVESAMYALRKTGQAPQDHVLCRNALACVVRIAQANAGHPKEMSDKGFCEAIVKLMQWHLGDGDCVEQGYIALYVLANDSEEIREAITHSGFPNIVSRAMLSHLDKPRLIEAGCRAIGTIAQNKTNRGMLGLAGSCEVVPHACNRHVTDHGVMEQGCYAAEQLQIELFENTGKLATASVNPMIASALLNHPSSPSVTYNALKAMCLVCQDPENGKELGLIAPFFQGFILSLRSHIHHAVIAQVACQALAAFVASNQYNRDGLGRNGACEVVKAALEQHSSQLGVVFRGSIAVWSLVNGSPQFAVKFHGLQPLLQALYAHPSVPPEVKTEIREAISRIR